MIACDKQEASVAFSEPAHPLWLFTSNAFISPLRVGKQSSRDFGICHVVGVAELKDIVIVRIRCRVAVLHDQRAVGGDSLEADMRVVEVRPCVVEVGAHFVIKVIHGA
jgi:hypothetical protein